MGHTLKTLAQSELKEKAVFDRRFVVELCERFHVHYRNIRFLLSLSDFLEMANGFVKALERWKKLGSPEPSPSTHIELTRRKVANDAVNDGIKVNYNKNLYSLNKGKIFAEGADFEEDAYIHLKIRDVRFEMSIDEYRKLAKVIREADETLRADSDNSTVLQTT